MKPLWSLDNFINVMKKIAQEIENQEDFSQYPKTTPVSKIDEVQAARHPDLKE